MLTIILALADNSYKQALRDDVYLANSLNVYNERITCQPVAIAHVLNYISVSKALNDKQRNFNINRTFLHKKRIFFFIL
jgi:alanine dehydrogenase